MWAYSLLVVSGFTTLFTHVQQKLRVFCLLQIGKRGIPKNIPREISSLTLGIPSKISSYTHKVLYLLKPWFWQCTPSANEMFCPEGCILKNSLSWDSSQSPCSSHTFTASLTARINLAAGSCMFSTDTHPCGSRILWWLYEQIKFSATSFATDVVTHARNAKHCNWSNNNK